MNLMTMSSLLALAFATPSFAASPQLVWNAWYTVTLNKKVPYAYYNDRVEKQEGRIIFRNQFWKSEEGFINEEQLASFAKDDAELTPLFYNFISTYRATTTKIDATANEQGMITIKARQGDQDLPIVTKSLPKKTFFSSFFPLWLARHRDQLRPKANVTFQSLLEDQIKDGFPVSNGKITVVDQDELAKKNGAQKLLVDYQSQVSTWYVLASGEVMRIEMPSQHAVVERVSEAKARAFLGKK